MNMNWQHDLDSNTSHKSLVIFNHVVVVSGTRKNPEYTNGSIDPHTTNNLHEVHAWRFRWPYGENSVQSRQTAVIKLESFLRDNKDSSRLL
ncbi:hypothetical protein AVEN_197412-1 [Araneus ventricosus]|uniref:Uncharacterized protein n=1 Tax=Araneus ventricosus TaxID=182803 RepID=A0A4Y2SH18_ARAVE|nr:hypothetical protein AVEN_197412-1 [Araneus ventricosus]